MKKEIERKYTVNNLPKDFKIQGIFDIEQCYIYQDFNTNVRVRKIKDRYSNNEIKYIYTVKTKGDIDYNNDYNIAKKYEIENEIKEEQYEKLKKTKISNIINKTRIIIPIEEKLKVEMDIYYDYLEGLLTAEIEFPNEEFAKNYKRIDWLGEELGYKEFSNRRLAEMTREEWQKITTKEVIENNRNIINQLKNSYNI